MIEDIDNLRIYVRRQGRILGQFDYEKVRSMVDNNLIFRTDQLSLDGVTWDPASKSEFFLTVPVPTRKQRPVRDRDSDRIPAQDRTTPPVSGESKVGSFDILVDPFPEVPGASLESIIEPVTQKSGAATMPPPRETGSTPWFYAIGEQQFGPIPQNELATLLSTGQIGPQTPVWTEGLAKWQSAGSTPALLSGFAPGQLGKEGNTIRTQLGGYCIRCGEAMSPSALKCSRCGEPIGGQEPDRNRTTAGILALLFGSFGIHKFYLRQPVAGFLRILFFWTLIPAILGLFEGISLLTMTDRQFAEKYRP
ncbi:DUF4339 domain-containing protein [bacterium]|nr:DUF4339 domain-containing protein [bacterium]